MNLLDKMYIVPSNLPPNHCAMEYKELDAIHLYLEPIFIQNKHRCIISYLDVTRSVCYIILQTILFRQFFQPMASIFVYTRQILFTIGVFNKPWNVASLKHLK